MKKILFASSSEDVFKEVKKAFKKEDVYETIYSNSKKEILDLVKDQFITLIVIDENINEISGHKLCEDIVKINAMSNTSLISSLTDNEFHEVTEGLGVLMKLPKKPTFEDGVKLEQYLSKIINPS